MYSQHGRKRAQVTHDSQPKSDISEKLLSFQYGGHDPDPEVPLGCWSLVQCFRKRKDDETYEANRLRCGKRLIRMREMGEDVESIRYV